MKWAVVSKNITQGKGASLSNALGKFQEDLPHFYFKFL